MGYRIKSVAEMVGVPRNTLLAWERRYALVKPSRRENGYREYSPEDVAKIRELKALIDAGHRVGEAISLLREKQAAADRAAESRAASGIRAGMDAISTRLRDALIDYDRDTADEIARSLHTRPYRERIDEVLFPAMRDIGEMWSNGEISISQEHFASAWCREKMMGMLMTLGFGPENGPVAVCAGFPEERHELGLLGVAIQLALQGYRINWLGADIPGSDLADALRREAPSVACISVLQPRPAKEFEAYARVLRDAAPTSTRIIIGGAGLPEDGLPAVDGVDWVRDASHLRA